MRLRGAVSAVCGNRRTAMCQAHWLELRKHSYSRRRSPPFSSVARRPTNKPFLVDRYAPLTSERCKDRWGRADLAVLLLLRWFHSLDRAAMTRLGPLRQLRLRRQMDGGVRVPLIASLAAFRRRTTDTLFDILTHVHRAARFYSGTALSRAPPPAKGSRKAHETSCTPRAPHKVPCFRAVGCLLAISIDVLPPEPCFSAIRTL